MRIVLHSATYYYYFLELASAKPLVQEVNDTPLGELGHKSHKHQLHNPVHKVFVAVSVTEHVEHAALNLAEHALLFLVVVAATRANNRQPFRFLAVLRVDSGSLQSRGGGLAALGWAVGITAGSALGDIAVPRTGPL